MSLSRRQWLFYSVPGLVTAIPTIPVFTLVPAYYAETLGIGLALTGFILFLSRALDIVSDPIVGWFVDRDWPASVKRLVLWGALLSIPGIFMLLAPVQGAGAVWLLVSSTLLYLGWTVIQIPYLSWGAQISNDYNERTKITAGREFAILIGILLSGSLPAVLGGFGMSDGESLAAIGVVAVAIGVPAFWWLLSRVPAPPRKRQAENSWRGLQRNGLFVRLLSAWLINGLANAFPAVLFVFYCQYVIQVEDQVRNLLLALYFACAVVGTPFWVWLSSRVNKHRTWSFAMMVTVPAFVIATFLGPGDVTVYAAICVITGLCLGADLILPPAIQADVADWDRFRFKRNRTGSLFALWNMSAKLALAIAAGVALPLLGFLNLGETEASAYAVPALIVIYAVVPSVLKLTAIGLVFRLPLTQFSQAAITGRLRSRDST